MSADDLLQDQLDRFRADFSALRSEIAKVIVGEDRTITLVLAALVAGGHVLVEGVSGVGKTTLVRTLAGALDLTFRRVQCTADLMPADLIGTYVITETPQGRRTFEFQRGPLFANIVLADQIHRATPKTQAAFLEAMEEGVITVSTESFQLPQPYLVVATQNPAERDGVFPLPEAQIDRFFFRLTMQAPSGQQMEQVLDRTTEAVQINVQRVVDAHRLLEMGQLVRQVPVADAVRRWAIALAAATHPGNERAPQDVQRFVRCGAGPRGVQALVLGAKVLAILEGRCYVSAEDVRAVAPAALGHRMLLNYEGEAENVAADALIGAVLQALPGPTV